MPNFSNVIIGNDKKNILKMINILKDSVEEADRITMCEIQSYQNMGNPYATDITIKMQIVNGDKGGIK